MKILLLSRAPLSYLGGIPVYLRNLYLQDFDSADEFSVFSLSSSLNSDQKSVLVFRHSDILIEKVYPSFWINHTLSLSFSYVCAVLRNARHHSYVHIQDPDPISSLLALIACTLFGTKYIVTWHASVLHKVPSIFSPLYWLFQQLLYFKAHKLFFFTHAHYESFLSSYSPIRDDKLVFLPMPSPSYLSTKYSSIKAANTFTLLFIGRLVSYKGLDVLFKALEHIKFSLRVVIIGTGPLLDNYTKIANIDTLSHHEIIFLSSADNYQKKFYLNTSHVLLLPSISQSEALGIVQLEAMSCSLPIINTLLNNGVNEIAPNGLCALTVEAGSSYALANSIETIYSDPVLYSSLACGSLARYNQLAEGSSLHSFISQLS